VTDSNRYGPGVSWRDMRRWAIAGIGLWFPAYLRDAERHHGLAAGYCALPAGFRTTTPQEDAAVTVPERVKHPEQRLPLILVISPGTTDSPPIREPDRTLTAEWAFTLAGLVHGKNEDEAELVASVYGLALVQMTLQQAGAWADLTAYQGPSMTVESVEPGTPLLDFSTLEVTRRRSLVAAEATFTVVFRNSATSLGPQTPPPVDPTEDPGAWPEIITTELQVDREGISE
jgi:hypothetical protein